MSSGDSNVVNLSPPAEEASSALDRFNQIIVELSRRRIRSSDDLTAAIEEITSRAAIALNVSFASIWVFDEGHTELKCKSIYDRVAGTHSPGPTLKTSQISAYYRALTTQRTLVVNDTKRDQLTREYYTERLEPLGVASLLDAPLWADGQLFGVVSFLQTGLPREWSVEEQYFVSSIADMVALAMHASERRRYEKELSFRFEFEKLILSLSTHFINLDAEKIHEGVHEALARLGEFSGVDRTYLFFFREDGEMMDNRYEWCAAGIPSYKDLLQGVAVNYESRFVQKITNLEIVHVPQVHRLPDGLYLEKPEWIREKIKSLVCVPLISGGKAIGFLGFDSVQTEKTWSRDFVSLLKIAGGMLVNVEERRRAEHREQQLTSQIQHTQKLESLGVLAGGIAHDFNNLLMGMLANAELLLRILPSRSKQNQLAERVHRAAKRAADLTEQLLAYSGKGRFDIATVDLSDVVRDMMPLLETAVTNSALIHFVPSEVPASARVDVTQMQQVLLNLVTNASESIGESPGEIHISTGVIDADRTYLSTTYLADKLPAGLYTYIDLEDTGEGISDEMIAKIFDPFFSTKFTGRGLGLAVVMGIIRSHQGGIRVSSMPGCGTKFRVLLHHHQLEQVTEAQGKNSSKDEEDLVAEGLILVIDDEEITRSATKEMLEFSGFDVILAEGGQRGIALFQEHQANLAAVLLDMTMPVMSGVEVFIELNKINPNVPILMSSGYSEQDALEKIKDLPIAGFIQKPYGPTKLFEAIKPVII